MVKPQIPSNIHNDIVASINQLNLDSIGNMPLYPYEAYKNKISGWVLLKLYISIAGKVVDVELLASSPKGMYDNIAIKTAFKKKFPIAADNLDPKAYTKNIEIKYGVDS